MDFKEIFETLKKQVEELATSTLKNYKTAAIKDGKQLLEAMKDDLKRWTLLLADKKLTTKDFEWLVNSQKDLVQLSALKQAGLAAIRIDQFRASVLNLIVDTVFNLVLL